MINKKDSSPYQFACIRKMLSIRSDGIHMELFYMQDATNIIEFQRKSTQSVSCHYIKNPIIFQLASQKIIKSLIFHLQHPPPEL